ncbi:MAG: ATP-binding protein [Candidatus Electrothrix scaldis]|nr:MAG: ATP-binding protein [Candidatus Electrothrix sp. GW3-3]
MQYIKECLQLLYWIYFKPYTLKRHVQEICPEINNPYRDNIYRRSAEAKANPRLKRYDEQIWRLTVFVPIAAVFLSAPLAEGVARFIAGDDALQFNWWLSSFFLIGWLPGQMIVQTIQNTVGEKIALRAAISAIFLLYFSESLVTHFIADVFTSKAVLGVAVGLVAGIPGGVLFGVAGGMVAGVAFGVELGGTTGFAFGIAIGICAGVLFRAENDVVGYMTISVLVSMLSGIFFKAVFGVEREMEIFIFCIFGMLRIYFWLPELLWLSVLKLLPLQPVARLPVLPPRFDQLIYLPLPFIPTFIAEAYQENRSAARQTIDYLITSTNQQKVARKAMSLIAAEECRHCRTTGEIASLREQLAWLSEEPSPGLTACLDISQDVTAALEASTLYRQAQQLDKVISKIERKRNALSAASAREATSFGSVLDNWQGILETARKTLREQAAQSNEIHQVYLAGPALDPNKAGPLFKGRRDLFRQIETLTLSAQHPTLVMHGGRRSGKTSTLNYLPQWLPSDILPLLIDGQSLAATSTLSGFAEEFADLISKSARKVHSLKLPALASVTTSDDPFVTLRRWLDAVEQAVPDKTLLLCLDEFERLDEIVRSTDSRAPLNFLRHLIQHRERWTLLFTGVLTPEELPAYWSDYLINCETLRVSYLAEADCLELIQHPVEDFPDIYPTPVAHAIRDLTGGQPYFTQLLCHELVEQLNRKKAKTVQMDDLQTVLPAVFERGYQVFREFWQSLTDPQRALLRAVAEAKTPSEEAMRAAPVLVRKEVLAQQNGGWYFRVPLLRRWLVEGQGGLS